MGEPLSIAASVAGLITISAQIVGMAKDLFDKVRDAPETMMRVSEEVESMQPIFCQVQLLLHGAGPRPNHGNLTMISVHSLMATLTGCVIVYSRLEQKVSEVCGFSDLTTAIPAWKRAGVVVDRIKWGLWRHKEVMGIIEDLQRQKINLILMLTTLCCTTTAQASENQAKFQEQTTKVLQSNHTHSVMLQELISRQEDQARENTSNLAGPTVPTTSSPGNRPFDGYDNSDNASIISKRSTLSLRLGRSDYMEDLKASRAYKRLRHFGRGIDSSAESVFSFDTGCSAGHWSLLSDITLGDLSVSEIAVLNLPINLADVSNPEPFQAQLSMETSRSPKPQTKRSSRGRIHNAIENGNGLVVRALLAMGIDVEEVDSNGRTPLLHAIEKHNGAICKALVEKGASITRDASSDETLLTRPAYILHNLDIHDYRSFDDICEALLDNRSNTDIKIVGNMAGELIAVRMHDVVNKGYKSILQLLSLTGSRDAEGWTPLASAAFSNNEALCEALVEKRCTLCLNTEQKNQLKPKLWRRIHDPVKRGHKTALQLLLDMGADINERTPGGTTALLEAVDKNHLSCVKMLIERGADATISNDGYSVLHFAACRSTDSEMMKFLVDVVETRKQVNMKSSYGSTALHCCCYNSAQNPAIQSENAKMLLQAGASITIETNDGRTPYDLARDWGRKELAKYLWSQLSPEQQA